MRTIAILAVVFVLAGTQAAAATPDRTISVSGFASIRVTPDHATVDIGVDTSDKATVKAVEDNARLMTKVVEAIRALGVSNKAMQTSRFSIEAQHPIQKDGYSPDNTVTLGYAVANTLTIDVDDVTKVPQIIDAAVRAGANISNAVVFTVKERQALDDKVLADAVKDARRNAEIMAAAEGLKVGKAVTMSNSGIYPDMAMGVNANRIVARRISEPVIMPGQVDVSAGVSVTFSLE